MKRTYFFLLSFSLLATSAVHASTPAEDSATSYRDISPSQILEDALGDQMPEHFFRIALENDVFFGTDKDYTNGLRVDYAQAIDKESYWGISLTQNIYTPYTNSSYVRPGEHPYSGYLALGAAYITVGENFGTSTEFQIGVTGDESYARDTQRIIHGVAGLFQWRGWDNQIPAEVTFQLSSRQDYNLASLELDTTNGLQTDSMIFTREELGTVSVRAGAGYVFRLGYNLPPFLRQLGNRAANLGVSSLIKKNYDANQDSYIFIASLLGEYVAHDLSIDGGVFHDFQSTATREPWQIEAQMGAAIVHEGVSYYIGAYYSSKRYTTQFTDNFHGIISISWAW